jgi:hypothetical protein
MHQASICIQQRSFRRRSPACHGRAWVATAIFEGEEIIRACITNGESGEHDVDELAAALRLAAEIDSREQPKRFSG